MATPDSKGKVPVKGDTAGTPGNQEKSYVLHKITYIARPGEDQKKWCTMPGYTTNIHDVGFIEHLGMYVEDTKTYSFPTKEELIAFKTKVISDSAQEYFPDRSLANPDKSSSEEMKLRWINPSTKRVDNTGSAPNEKVLSIGCE